MSGTEKISEITVEVKKSHNFQTYTAGVKVIFDEPITQEEVGQKQRKYFGLCRQEVIGQIKLDRR